MHSVSVKSFFSCSFREEDANINDHFRAICEGLDIVCANVDGGYAAIPPQQAREMISECDVLIAIAVRRNKFQNSDDFAMPEAVSNEISFAYGLQKPLLVIRENGARAEGFLNNYGTHLIFERGSIHDIDFVRKAVKSIHGIKMVCISDHELLLSQEVTEFIAESASHLYELEKEGDDYVWHHSQTRKIVFTKNYTKPLKISRWNDEAEGQNPAGLPSIKVNFNIINASKPFKWRIEYEQCTAFGVTADIIFDPTPYEGDFIEYDLSYRGRHLLPVWNNEVYVNKKLRLHNRVHTAYDGIVPVNRAKHVTLQYRIPREYGLSISDIDFFVGSFTKDVDYIVESEIDRAEVDKENIGSKLTLTARISSPLLRHIYGIAWSPPTKPFSGKRGQGGIFPTPA